jgi:hypothetical protein
MLGDPDALLARINATPNVHNIFFETQGAAALTCLVHALNNILGEHMIDIARMKQFARDMFLRHVVAARRRGDHNLDIDATRRLFYDPRWGHFSRGVAFAFAKMAMGLKLKVVYPRIGTGRQISNAGRDELMNLLIHGHSKSYFIFESERGEGHAFCSRSVKIDAHQTIVFILNSLKNQPNDLQPADVAYGCRY